MNYTQNERIAQVSDNTLVVGMILIDPYTAVIIPSFSMRFKVSCIDFHGSHIICGSYAS